MNTNNTNFKFIYADITTSLEIPLFKGGLSAGFPSPAANYMAKKIDLNKTLVRKPNATFYGIADGDSMNDAYIHDGDLVIVDRSAEIKHGRKILCCLNGEFLIKFVNFDKADKDIVWLVAGNQKYKPLKITNEMDFKVWGVVTFSITSHDVYKFE